MLEERLRLMRIEKYGAGGEKLSHAQLELFELEPVPSELIMEAESKPEPLHRSTKKSGQASGPPEIAGRSISTRGAGSALHAGSARLQTCGKERW